ncbi:hypothetical protein AUP68_12059 [Ilyonectria robusta]
MPVSGSKVPAEQGNLVGMMAGDLAIAESIRPVLEPITNAAVYCGPIGSGLQTKYAVNLYLVAMTVGLAESFNLARAQGLNLEALGKVLEMGPMASAYSKIKVAKIIKQDWSAQASIKDCHNSTQLIQSAAKAAKVQSPLLETCGSLYEQAKNSGLQEEDMIAIWANKVEIIEEPTPLSWSYRRLSKSQGFCKEQRQATADGDRSQAYHKSMCVPHNFGEDEAYGN